MENNRYPYSPIISRKPLTWPNGAHVAVWVIPNIEWFDIGLRQFGAGTSTEIVPDVRNYSQRDYGNRVGVWRIMEVLDKHEVRATVALNAAICDHCPQIITEARKLGWEFMGHGLTNSWSLANLPEDKEREVIHQVVEKITASTGKKPEGWLGPGLQETFNTPDILAEEGIKYVADWPCDDQPFEMKVKKGRLFSIPYSVGINDMPAFNAEHHTASEFYEMIKDQFDALYREGATQGRVMAIALHPFLTGVPYRIRWLDKAIHYIKGHEKVWFATGAEIINWYSGQK
ncbi:MAG: polysaccharide deacetylase family protein [Chloroflexi bacterium]|nr:polysaccharide deacetylase family protein [Chloroflexota bacterium]